MSKTCLGDVMTDARPFIEEASTWADTLVHNESRGPGDYVNARRRLANKLKIPHGKLWDLKYRSPASICVSIYFALRNAYQAECERQLRRLAHELEITKKIAGSDGRAVSAAETLVEKAKP